MESETVKLRGFSMADIKDSVAVQPVRRRLPDERQAIVHHFNVGGYEGCLTVGLYEDGQPGEIFITTAKEGSTVSGLMDCFATAVRSRCSTACHSAFCVRSFLTRGSIPAAGLEMRILVPPY